MATEITKENFSEITATNHLVVIDFWAPWCGPCRALSPIIEELSKKYENEVVICKCNTDEQGELAMEFGVRNIPMMAFLKNGELKDTRVGYHNKEDLEKLIDSLK